MLGRVTGKCQVSSALQPIPEGEGDFRLERLGRAPAAATSNVARRDQTIRRAFHFQTLLSGSLDHAPDFGVCLNAALLPTRKVLQNQNIGSGNADRVNVGVHAVNRAVRDRLPDDYGPGDVVYIEDYVRYHSCTCDLTRTRERKCPICVTGQVPTGEEGHGSLVMVTPFFRQHVSGLGPRLGWNLQSFLFAGG
jgi:hypothetical protein